VQQTDLLPTLLSLAGLPAAEGVQGRDLSARWVGKAGPEASAPLVYSEERFAVVDKFSVRAGRFKLILNNDGPALWRAGSHEELYDLARDPGEKRNLVSSRPVMAAFLGQRLERFREAQAALLARAGATAVPLTEAEKEQLRALGYVQ
jgi:arylsulfatase A-like enzyme